MICTFKLALGILRLKSVIIPPGVFSVQRWRLSRMQMKCTLINASNSAHILFGFFNKMRYIWGPV